MTEREENERSSDSTDKETKRVTFQSVKISLDDLPELVEQELGDKLTVKDRSYSLIMRSNSIDSLNSLSSMYSASVCKGDYDITGEVEMGAKYRDGQLQVHVVRAKSLATAKQMKISSPYAKVYLLPDCGKQSKRKTSVQRKTTNPVFNEILKVLCNK